jgi:hypothetical protein
MTLTERRPAAVRTPHPTGRSRRGTCHGPLALCPFVRTHFNFFSLLLTRSGRIKTTEFFSIKSLLERLLIWDVIPRGRWLFVSLSCALGLCRSFAGPVSVVGCFHWHGRAVRFRKKCRGGSEVIIVGRALHHVGLSTTCTFLCFIYLIY